MSIAADFADFDVPALRHRLEAAALHQDRCRRQAACFDLSDGFIGTREAAAEMDVHAAAIAEGARLAAAVQRLLIDESTRRPAPVLHLVPPARPHMGRGSLRTALAWGLGIFCTAEAASVEDAARRLAR